jgi:hypothetical protein
MGAGQEWFCLLEEFLRRRNRSVLSSTTCPYPGVALIVPNSDPPTGPAWFSNAWGPGSPRTCASVSERHAARNGADRATRVRARLENRFPNMPSLGHLPSRDPRAAHARSYGGTATHGPLRPLECSWEASVRTVGHQRACGRGRPRPWLFTDSRLTPLPQACGSPSRLALTVSALNRCPRRTFRSPCMKCPTIRATQSFGTAPSSAPSSHPFAPPS